ncbi:MAG TPA: GNAT family N-acetyltransferase, partial [Burkholderiaceae bacterium]|nr:GNAT family N-acetyltransferase [Burkholderiaceae bacterium]
MTRERVDTTRPVVLRNAAAADAPQAGRILFDAFAAIAGQHRFPADFPSAAAGISLVEQLIAHPSIFSVVAETGGRVAGSNFLWQLDSIAGIGPITVDPALQNEALGRALMRAVLEQADRNGFAGTRLVQAAYHNRSLALYSKLGFRAREPLSVLNGTVIGERVPERPVRIATADDVNACSRLAERVLGRDRANELRDAIGRG